MFLDLHQGILEEFADAQCAASVLHEAQLEERIAHLRAGKLERRRWRRWVKSTPRPARRADPVRSRALAKARKERAEASAARKLEEVRAQRVPWTPPRPRVELRPCARCGEPAEFREGVRWPVGHRCSKK